MLINTARGEVVDTVALLHHPELIACLDVWENEPHISLELLQQATIATPHIAGYSLASKRRAVEMVYQQAVGLFNWPPLPNNKSVTGKIMLPTDWEKRAVALYNPIKHTEEFRKALIEHPDHFGRLREQYPLRDEFL